MAETITINGLRQFVTGLRRADAALPKQMRIALNDAMGVVVDYSTGQMPKRTGRAARSVRGRSTRTQARVAEGGARAPYVPWLDFGGKVGKGRSVDRPFYSDGRYLYKALVVRREAITEALQGAVRRVAEQAGWEVD